MNHFSRSVIASTALAAALGTSMPAQASTAHTSRYVTSVACTHEDGAGQRVCVWDASRRGNGVGRSFVSLYGGDATVAIRTPHSPVSKRSPLVVTITGDGTATVVHGRTVLANRVSVLG